MVERLADRGIHWYQGRLYKNAIDLETWRKEFYNEDFSSPNSGLRRLNSEADFSFVQQFCSDDFDTSALSSEDLAIREQSCSTTSG